MSPIAYMRRPSGSVAGARDSVIIVVRSIPLSASRVPRHPTVGALVHDHAVEKADRLRGTAELGNGICQRLVLISTQNGEVLLLAGPFHQLGATGEGKLEEALSVLSVHERS